MRWTALLCRAILSPLRNGCSHVDSKWATLSHSFLWHNVQLGFECVIGQNMFSCGYPYIGRIWIWVFGWFGYPGFSRLARNDWRVFSLFGYWIAICLRMGIYVWLGLFHCFHVLLLWMCVSYGWLRHVLLLGNWLANMGSSRQCVHVEWPPTFLWLSFHLLVYLLFHFRWCMCGPVLYVCGFHVGSNIFVVLLLLWVFCLGGGVVLLGGECDC
jgi:hypothetical protein